MKVNPELATGTLRISVGRVTSEREVEVALIAIIQALELAEKH